MGQAAGDFFDTASVERLISVQLARRLSRPNCRSLTYDGVLGSTHDTESLTWAMIPMRESSSSVCGVVQATEFVIALVLTHPPKPRLTS